MPKLEIEETEKGSQLADALKYLRKSSKAGLYIEV